MKRISTQVGSRSIENANDLGKRIDKDLRKGGTVSAIVVREPLTDDEGQLLSHYPHPDTRVPISLLVDRSISTEFALRH